MPPDFLQDIARLKASQQAGSDYGLFKSLVLKDELARYWSIGNDMYATYAQRKQRWDLESERVGIGEWMSPLLRTVFGYDDLERGGSVTLGEDRFTLTHRACRGAVPLLIVTQNYHLDRAEPRFGYEGLRRTPHALMQEFLNADDSSLWGIVSNGSKFRMLRDNSSLTRPAYIEADLELIFEEDLYSDFATLWLTAHASRLKPQEEQPPNPSTCIIENWRVQAHQVGERVRENLRDGVTQALRQLGNGFLQHRDNEVLRTALAEGDFTPAKFFQQLLRLVYRLLFLLTAEERDLLHDPAASDAQRSLYAEGYSLARLRERAARRRHYDHYPDLWQGLQIVFRALAEGAPALGLPGLGGLFHQEQCPELDSAILSNAHLLEAMRSLCYFHSGRSLTRVNYRNMGTEELGSIYESLLELHPEIDVETTPWTFRFIGEDRNAKAKGSERKLTGSYYTPPSLVRELIKSALEPVLKRAVTERPENPKAAILDLKILDPACGSGHFLLAVARRMAVEIARIESGSSNSADEILRQHALREVVQHCIYGVDRNPLAVELCKAALWIETVDPGKPLTFLTSHIRLGDSLVGILDPETMADGIPGAAYQALSSDDKRVCRKLKEDNKKRYAAVQWNLLDQSNWMPISRVGSRDLNWEPEETMQDINRKGDAWQAYREDIETEAYPADLFIGAYFAKKSRDNIDAIPYTGDLTSVRDGSIRPAVKDETKRLAQQYRFFHWYLDFAEIMQNGGFDVVLGNPPWERIKLQEQEFFAARAPDIAGARNKAERNRLIQALIQDDAWPAEKDLFADFQAAKRRYEATSLFVRTGGRFPLTGVGDVNTYAVFAETILELINPKGRAGLIVPTNIATDNSTKAFFHKIVAQKRLASLYSFENREKIFSNIDGRINFCLLTLNGTKHPCSKAKFSFYLHCTDQLNDVTRLFSLSAEDFALFNPNTRTCPIFRTRRDMEIARKMYRRAGVLWKEASGGEPEINPWGISFQGMFHMSNDSGLFRTREELVNAGWELQGNVFSRGKERYLPLYEAKMFHQYDHRFATFDRVSAEDIKKGNALYMTSGHKADSQAVAIPRYWVPEQEALKRLERASVPPPHTRPYTPKLENWRGVHTACYPEYCPINRRKDRSDLNDAVRWTGAFRNDDHYWFIAFRRISRATDRRSLVSVIGHRIAMSDSAFLIQMDPTKILQALRSISNSTNERTILVSHIPESAVGHSASVIDYECAQAVASALVLANMNSLPLDWAARLSMGGTNLSYFIMKQLPVLDPEIFLHKSLCGKKHFELIVPRVLELTYTADDLQGFAKDLGYNGSPFAWDDNRRHCLKCELDAIFAHMYQLERPDLEWILDAPPPGSSFPSLKNNEMKEFGEYRTKRYVLHAYDQLKRGELPNLADVSP